ncbi:sulfotransferase family protein [Alteromonas sp. BL110]|uniref:sulfotransferase family protein n=1 Tax=Alteromonas sp. BL110 TaxID=1714845 RepID=UPI000E4A327D|nr:sulfotransferase [Alteromonas sp. BL110]AXT37612.1 sulfotransferase family protein [Alteromonas sp. BL110]RKM80350.1 sulfotransferase family protein [Alteromonas sp. BL110]
MNQLLKQLVSAAKSTDRASVVEVTNKLLSLKAPLNERWLGVAQIAMSFGCYLLAKRCIEQTLKNGLQDTVLAQALGMLSDCGNTKQAYKFIQAIGEAGYNSITLLHLNAVLAYQLGEFETAKALLNEILKRAPESGESAHLLSTLLESDEAQHLEAQLTQLVDKFSKVPNSVSKACFYNGLSILSTKLNKEKQSFSYIQKSAETMRALSTTNAQFDYGPLSQWAKDNSQYLSSVKNNIAGQHSKLFPQPIFILGLPRSGTTLVEQILVSNVDALSVGELNAFSCAVDNVFKTKNTLDSLRSLETLDAEKCYEIAEEYQRICEEYLGEKAIIIDKSLSNLRYAHVIARVFPDAKLIVTKREMIQNAWSIFRTHFSNGLNWSWDISTIKRVVENETELSEAFCRQYRFNTFSIETEELQKYPETVSSQLIEFVCANSSEIKLLQKANNKGNRSLSIIKTASMYQARRPIKMSSAMSNHVPSDFKTLYETCRF